MSKKVKPGLRFLHNGKAGNHPGEGAYTFSGLGPWSKRPAPARPLRGPRKPPKGLKP